MIKTLHKANINNLTILPRMNDDFLHEYHILAEWSRLPIETFDSRNDAEDFIKGFKLLDSDKTKAYIQGTMLRKCVETDIKDGIVYEKVLDMDSL